MMRYRAYRITSLLLVLFTLFDGTVPFQPPLLRMPPTHSSLRAPGQGGVAARKKIASHYSQRHDASHLNAISPAAALSAVGSPVGSVAVLALVILVHEAGHFIAARSFGIDVDEFSVGVGPRILGVRQRLVDGKVVFEKIDNALGNEETSLDGIEFSLRAIPFGGYVRFPENYNRL